MGVTLERVQNKFACIIGELCSEPVILSQFAIWLDLRLAEYKAKGAISLDCSGDNPDPIWLNGHRLLLPKTHPRDRHSGRYGGTLSSPKSVSQHHDVSWSRLSAERGSVDSTAGYHDAQPQTESLPSVEERLSPSSVMVKEEPSESDQVFPISLHRHEATDGRLPHRKRTAAETVASSHEKLTSDSHSPSSTSTPKIRRVSSPADHDLNPTSSDPSTNQSLMSIISGEVPEHQPPETVDLIESDINIIMDYENRESTSSQQRENNSRPSFASQPSAASGSEYAARSDDSMNTAHGSVVGRPGAIEATPLQTPTTSRMAATPMAGGHPGNVKMDASFALLMMSAQQENTQLYSDDDNLWWTTVKPVMYPLTYPETLSNKNIRARIPDGGGKPQQTVVDIVTAVGTVERWMWKKYSETRSIERMPPDHLNRYLTEFYPLLRRPNGKEYDPKSLTNFKSRLDRFLKENHYPCSINKSDIFATSQQAFANKRRAITAKRSQSLVPLPQTSCYEEGM